MKDNCTWCGQQVDLSNDQFVIEPVVSNDKKRFDWAFYHYKCYQLSEEQDNDKPFE